MSNVRAIQLTSSAVLIIITIQGATGFSTCVQCSYLHRLRARASGSTVSRASGLTLLRAVENGDGDKAQCEVKKTAPRVERQPASRLFLPWIDGLFDGGVAEILIVLFTVGILSPFLFLAVVDPLKAPSTDIVRKLSGTTSTGTDIEWVEQEPLSNL